MADEKKTGHTPGPWEDVCGTVMDGSGDEVANVATRVGWGANARLVAAAPEMAEVLAFLLEHGELTAEQSAAVRWTLQKAGVLQ